MTIALYLATVLIWGTTWFAIKFQLGTVASEVSVGYRFFLAGTLLSLFLFLFRRQEFKDVFKTNVQKWILLQAILTFGLNYILTYQATVYLTSGLVAVVFSTLTILNAMNSRIFLKQKLERGTLVATALGLTGISLFFIDDLKLMQWATLPGILLILGGTYLASLGNMVAVKVKEHKISIFAVTALGMVYGGVFCLALSQWLGKPLIFDWSVGYMSSLAYLSLFGSIIAFLCYFKILQTIGPNRAAYATVLFPVIAIAISVLFENYQLTYFHGLGFILVFAGNIFALGFEKKLLKWAQKRVRRPQTWQKTSVLIRTQ